MGLRQFIVARLLLTLPMFFIVVTAVFIVMRAMPGDPAVAILGEAATPQLVELLRQKLGLDKPLLVQYLDMWSHLFQGNLGASLRTLSPVTTEVSHKLPTTIELAIGGVLIGATIGILAGVEAAKKRETSVDYTTRLFTTLVHSTPIFWMGLLFQLLFGIELGLLPVSGNIGSAITLHPITRFVLLDALLNGNVYAFIDALRHYALPWLTIGLWFSAASSRLVRVNLVEALTQDYVTTARAKGLRENVVLYKHALRNALLPVLTLMGLQFTSLLGGAVVTETVFAFPGVGSLLWVSILNRDYPMIEGIMIVFTLVVAFSLLIIDLVYALIDPRVEY